MQWQIRGLLTELHFSFASAVFKTNSRIEIGLGSAGAAYTIGSVHRITHSPLSRLAC
jgi:hypothetical protein